MKLKNKPSQRVKRRYILIENCDKIQIEKIIIDFLGILGWAKAAPIFVHSKNRLILAIKREEMDNIRAAFEACKENIKINRVSGTIKGLKL